MRRTRREFLTVAAAAAAGLALPTVVPRPARAATTWTCPATIDNTGATDVSAALTDWLNTTGAPGDTFRLRWGQGYSPGLYRIGVKQEGYQLPPRN